MEITPSVDEGLGNSSYLVDLGDARALVIDPPRDVRVHQRLAEERRLTIVHSVETHLHADFVSGSRELAARGATILAPEASRLGFPHKGLSDRSELDLGGLHLRAIGTPGHTPEHLAYLILDDGRPAALFTGGALLPGSAARTDLIAPDQTEPLARALYRALHDRLLELPDDLPVYPTHGAGSFCSATAGGERTTTIGREREANTLLAAPDEDAFVERLLGTFGTYPTYFRRLREVNRRGPRVYGALPSLPSLTVEEVAQRIDDGAEVVDARPLEGYAAGHLPGSLSIALRGAFGSWLGWLVPHDRSLVFVLDPGQDRVDVVRQALGIGHEQLEGELRGGIDAWRAAGRSLATTELVHTLDPRATTVVDVRQASEFTAGHIPGSIPLELGALGAEGGRAMKAVPHEVTFLCGHGERAMSAASLAERVDRCPRVYVGSPRTWARATGQTLDRGRGRS